MRLKKNKKPSFGPRKQKLDLKSKLEWIIIVITLIQLATDFVKYILSKFQ